MLIVWNLANSYVLSTHEVRHFYLQLGRLSGVKIVVL